MMTDMANTAASAAMPNSCRLVSAADGAAWKAASAAGTRPDTAMWHSVRNTGCWKSACMSRYLRHNWELHPTGPPFVSRASVLLRARAKMFDRCACKSVRRPPVAEKQSDVGKAPGEGEAGAQEPVAGCLFREACRWGLRREGCRCILYVIGGSRLRHAVVPGRTCRLLLFSCGFQLHDQVLDGVCWRWRVPLLHGDACGHLHLLDEAALRTRICVIEFWCRNQSLDVEPRSKVQCRMFACCTPEQVMCLHAIFEMIRAARRNKVSAYL